jgi:hypothetical protein
MVASNMKRIFTITTAVNTPPTFDERHAWVNTQPIHADRRATELGAKDIKSNNVDPYYRGKVVVNEVTFVVTGSLLIDDIVHYCIQGHDGPDTIVGAVPACLCEIPDA